MKKIEFDALKKGAIVKVTNRHSYKGMYGVVVGKEDDTYILLDFKTSLNDKELIKDRVSISYKMCSVAQDEFSEDMREIRELIKRAMVKYNGVKISAKMIFSE